MRLLKKTENILKKNENYWLTNLLYEIIKLSDIINNKNESDIFRDIYIIQEKYNIVAKKYNISNKTLYNLRIKFSSNYTNLKTSKIYNKK